MYPAQIHQIAQLALPLLFLSGLIAGAAEPDPPVAPTEDHREMRHGATVVNNYFWLREKSNPKVVAYLEAENAYTKTMTAGLTPFQDALYKEMLGRVKQTDLSVPVRRGEYMYYARTEEGKQYPIQCRRKGSMEAPEEVLLDANELAKTHKFVGLGAFVVSDDQTMLAYTVDFTGFRQYGLQVKNLRTGETLPDTTERVDSVEWAADNHTLFLTTEDAVTKRSDKLWRHTLGGASLSQSTKRKTNSTISAWRKRATRNISCWASTAKTPPSFAGCARIAPRASSRCSCRAKRSIDTTSTTARISFISGPTRMAVISPS